MPIESWFQTPIYYTSVDNVDKVTQEINSALQITKTTQPWGDSVRTSFVYNKKNDFCTQTPSLEKNIIDNAQRFCQGLGMPDTLIEIAESWINFTGKDEYQNYHSHIPYDISGVYYHQTTNDGKDGVISFKDPCQIRSYSKLLKTQAPTVQHNAEKGKLILFPSFLEHAVLYNQTDIERISISFNLNILNH